MKAPDKCHLSVPSVFLPVSPTYSDAELAGADSSSYVSDSVWHTVALTDQLHRCMKYY